MSLELGLFIERPRRVSVGLKPQIAKCDLCSLCGAGMDDICHICFECKAIALAAKLLPHWTLGEVDVIAIGTAKKSHQFLNKVPPRFGRR